MGTFGITKWDYFGLDELISKLYKHSIVLVGGAPLAIKTNVVTKDLDFVGLVEIDPIELRHIFQDFQYHTKFSWPKVGYSGWVFGDGNFHCQYLGYNAHLRFDITTAQNRLMPGLVLQNCTPPEIIAYNIVCERSTQHRLKKYQRRYEKYSGLGKVV